jgi:RNA 3'-terminal phosphate cyclase
VDRFLADQLIIFCALAEGESFYIFPEPSEHIQSNTWLVREILGAEVSVKEREIWIKGVGYEHKDS